MSPTPMPPSDTLKLYSKPTGVGQPSAGYVSPGPISPCYCTGACQTGPCPNAVPYWRQPCGHVFPWHGVVPPSYCPICGSYIGPVYCPPAPQPLPYITHIHTTIQDGADA